MGKRGPASAPTNLKLLRGERNLNRINWYEPKPEQGDDITEPPPDMPDEARTVWDFTIDQLDRMGIAYKCDRDALAVFCAAVINHRKATKLIGETGVLVKGERGPVKNPALQIQRDAAAIIRAFAQEFGLTPSARTRIEVDRRNRDDADPNPFAGTGS